MPLPLSHADNRSLRIFEFEMRWEPLVVPRVALVTANTTQLSLSDGGAERVTESGTPMAQPWASGAVADAGAGVGAAMAAGVVGVAVTVVVSLSGHSFAFCPCFPQKKKLKEPSKLKYWGQF